jgi:hypothetical protein
MSLKSLLIVLLIAFAVPVYAQKVIKAKDAYKYAGKEVYVIGKIMSAGGPGYSDDMSLYLATDSTETGVAVLISFSTWSKYEDRKGLLAADVKGKIVKVYGKVERYGEQDPFIKIEKASNLKLLSK